LTCPSRAAHKWWSRFVKNATLLETRPLPMTQPGPNDASLQNAPKIRGYRIEEVLGRGGMGVVYRGVHTGLDRPVAIKSFFIDATGEGREGALARFLHEAQMLAQFGGRGNIVQVYDLATDSNGNDYIIMEFVEGMTLEQILASGAKPEIFDSVYLIAETARALQLAHEHKVIHRDIKPANIMVTHEGRVKVMDFGIARSPDSPVKTRLGFAFGTTHYMSPEQLQREARFDHRSDLYALTIVLYYLLCGQLPFDDPNPVVLIKKQRSQLPPPPSSINPMVAPALESIILRGLEKQPENRFQSASEMEEALRTFLRTGTAEGDSSLAGERAVKSLIRRVRAATSGNAADDSSSGSQAAIPRQQPAPSAGGSAWKQAGGQPQSWSSSGQAGPSGSWPQQQQQQQQQASPNQSQPRPDWQQGGSSGGWPQQQPPAPSGSWPQQQQQQASPNQSQPRPDWQQGGSSGGWPQQQPPAPSGSWPQQQQQQASPNQSQPRPDWQQGGSSGGWPQQQQPPQQPSGGWPQQQQQPAARDWSSGGMPAQQPPAPSGSWQQQQASPNQSQPRPDWQQGGSSGGWPQQQPPQQPSGGWPQQQQPPQQPAARDWSSGGMPAQQPPAPSGSWQQQQASPNQSQPARRLAAGRLVGRMAPAATPATAAGLARARPASASRRDGAPRKRRPRVDSRSLQAALGLAAS
jgi:serine/threonine protein kinase